MKDLFRDVVENKLVLVLMSEKEYFQRLAELISSVEKTDSMICYVCLSKPYTDVVEDLRERGIKTEKFIFIDVLSSHYMAPELKENCIFVSSPSNLNDIRKAVIKAVDEKGCSTVIFDTISTLLVYQQSHSIVKFTNELVSEKKHEDLKKMLIIIKDESTQINDVERLTRDLEMFADKKVDLTKKLK
jgi:hypothetical protein